MSQKQDALKMLKRGSITALSFFNNTGSLRLAPRILELRQEGHRITSTMVTKKDKRYCVYRLEKQ